MQAPDGQNNALSAMRSRGNAGFCQLSRCVPCHAQAGGGTRPAHQTAGETPAPQCPAVAIRPRRRYKSTAGCFRFPTEPPWRTRFSGSALPGRGEAGSTFMPAGCGRRRTSTGSSPWRTKSPSAAPRPPGVRLPGVRDWQELVADKELDLFVNALPSYLHPKATIEACRPGTTSSARSRWPRRSRTSTGWSPPRGKARQAARPLPELAVLPVLQQDPGGDRLRRLGRIVHVRITAAASRGGGTGRPDRSSGAAT